jgi:uncharacterized protein YjlB
MYLLESVKRQFEHLTGVRRPSLQQARATLRECKPKSFRFTDDGVIPNNPMLPLVVYEGAVRHDGSFDPAAVLEQLFESSGWTGTWRNGIYDYGHFHSATHEVLGVARGQATVRFGGMIGRDIPIAAGDVAILPAGTGHQRLSASSDFLVVGGYPDPDRYDECTGKPAERARALESIPRARMPDADPVFGRDGPLRGLWQE